MLPYIPWDDVIVALGQFNHQRRKLQYGVVLYQGMLQKQTHVHTNMHAHARTHARTHAHVRTHARTRTHTHACTHARTRAHTHTHTAMSVNVHTGIEEAGLHLRWRPFLSLQILNSRNPESTVQVRNGIKCFHGDKQILHLGTNLHAKIGRLCFKDEHGWLPTGRGMLKNAAVTN